VGPFGLMLAASVITRRTRARDKPRPRSRVAPQEYMPNAYACAADGGNPHCDPATCLGVLDCLDGGGDSGGGGGD
jgi:hypothetical protein